MSRAPQYLRVPESELVWCPLDAVTLLYHRRSGLTHIVVEPVPEILQIMGAMPVDAATIAARLAERYDLARDLAQADAATLIGARLEELATLGLAERMTADA